MKRSNGDEPLSIPRQAALPQWVFPKGAFSDGAGDEPERLPTLIDGVSVRPALSEQEQERREADYLTALFAAADAYGRGPEGMSRRAPSRALPYYALPKGFNMAPNFLVGHRRDTNVAYHVWLHGFDFSHGNGHFFDRHEMAPVRVRPLIHSDRMNPRRASHSSTGWFDEAANALLWLDRGHGVTVFLLHLHSLGDCRDPFTIERAIGCAWGQYRLDFPAAVEALP